MSGNSPGAYSRLRAVLAEKNLTVFQLHRQLASAGLPVNIKSLYRLASDSSLQKVDLRVARAICQACGIELGELITFDKPSTRLQRLKPEHQDRLDGLMDKNNEGELTAREQKEFATLASEAHRISLENARLLLAERRSSKSSLRPPKAKARETVAA